MSDRQPFPGSPSGPEISAAAVRKTSAELEQLRAEVAVLRDVAKAAEALAESVERWNASVKGIIGRVPKSGMGTQAGRAVTRRAAIATLLALILGFALGRGTAAAPRSAPEPSVTAWGRVMVAGTPSEAPAYLGVASPAPVAAALAEPFVQPTTAPAATPGGSQAASVASPGRGTNPSQSVAVLTGTASWYRYLPGQAAAGPRLRALLGPSWRGMVVTVSGIPVRLTDWCQCFEGTATERVIDLDSRTVIALGFRLSAGLYEVTVTW